MATPKKVILVDGTAFIYRAFFAIPGNFSTASGLHTNAIYGFALMFKKLFAGRDPAYAAVIFDAPGATFRDEQYPAYKAHRPRMPQELREQLPYIDQLVEAHNFPIFRVEGYEADDVIGTLAREAEAEGHEVVVVSGDKDFAQIITDNVKMLDALRDITYDPELVKKKWGVPPHQFVDYLALLGDKIDNIPGVPGIGQKGAAKLLETYGDLDGIIAHIDDLKGKQQKSLLENKDQAQLSKELATIDRHVALPFTWDELSFEKPDQAVLNDLYKELEFFSLLEKDDLEGDYAHETEDYAVVTDAATLKAFLDDDGAPIAINPLFDLPTPVTGKLVGLSFAKSAANAIYVPLADGVLEVLKGYFEDPVRDKVVYNAKFLEVALSQRKIALTGITFDVLLASYLIDPAHLIPHNLPQIVKWYLHRTLEPVKAIVGAGKKERPFSALSVEAVSDYACHLAAAIWELHGPMAQKLEYEGHTDHLFDVDLPLSHVLARMEIHGILVDKADLAVIGKEFAEKLAGIEAEIFEHAGQSFNVNSTKQLSKVLFEDLGLPVIKRTKSGYSTNAEVLERLLDKHPIAGLLLEYRKINKLINTYTDVLTQAVNPTTGRVHATFQQTVSTTGRLISTEPDLQRTPIKTPEGKRIRRAFVAPPGHHIVSADWSQIELRILADRSEDPLLIEAFTQGLDVHRRTAGQIFDKPREEVTDDERAVGKTINFATIYGQGATALSQQLKIPRKQAEQYIQSYFNAYAGVKAWVDDTVERALTSGYVETMLGRRRYIPELSSNAFMERQTGQRMAANTPIQGSAADICKLAMLRIDKALTERKLGAKMVLQIHDELLFEVPDAELDEVEGLARDVMQSVVNLRVPLLVDVGRGASWADAK